MTKAKEKGDAPKSWGRGASMRQRSGHFGIPNHQREER
ncbi:hypothetical protein BTH_II1078 [Burkholderia thailandensis E264]|uniref:Uncharacterized protein n=1 Tax=Burkholderia thailandensis (strain ATCC 700388 / DSM 13276 / CCUG 48851 / CIP 106301 / E264) TaxID=271848 RepID=Q2T427_BURTA|nr:hypothetical protein BTH_II1878 [Burkholderia thailandensis E264]ABC34993.1 hypothetical protein BTH_II1078 [Burkholderia thailandensis E264]